MPWIKSREVELRRRLFNILSTFSALTVRVNAPCSYSSLFYEDCFRRLNEVTEEKDSDTWLCLEGCASSIWLDWCNIHQTDGL